MIYIKNLEIFLSLTGRTCISAKGNRCGNFTSRLSYCPKEQCCSKYGYCANSTTHCGEDCQILFGRCNPISSCTLAGRQNFFPPTPYFQRGLKNEAKNYWFPLCNSEQIFYDTLEPRKNATCGADGSLPELIKPNCGSSVDYF